MKTPDGIPIAEPGKVVLHIELADTGEIKVDGIRFIQGGGQKPLLPPEVPMLLARTIDALMAEQVRAMEAKAPPGIMLARGGPFKA